MVESMLAILRENHSREAMKQQTLLEERQLEDDPVPSAYGLVQCRLKIESSVIERDIDFSGEISVV